ncbi:MAG: transglycosylase domain-containing protein [bacterium]|nr:transglycosylase domain-containing protein [bacterium]
MGKEEKKKKKKKAVSPRRRRIKLAFKIFILVFLLLILVAGIVFYFKYGKDIFRLQSEAKDIVAQSSEETFKMDQTSFVYDSKGEVIAKLKGSKDINYVSINDIPKYAREAVISIEDKSFASHGGIDISANIRAVVALVKNKGEIKQGASTITQQLARNMFLTFDQTWQRKVKEIFVAVELEKKYTKMQILEYYLNNIYFANGYYGIQSASRGYFSKDINELSLSQITFLLSIPNNPTLYNPVEKMENTLKRRDRILDQMLADGKISEKECNDAKNEKIKLKREKIEKQTYVDSFVLFCATESLMEANGFEFKYKFDSDDEKDTYDKEYSEQYSQCQQDLYSKGYNIYTSIDTDKQGKLQETLDDKLSNFTDVTEDGIYKMQGSAVCIDNSTGRVVAIVGGREQKDVTSYLNRGYQSYRQPGSTIKPLIDYLPALQSGYTADSIVVDKKIPDGPSNSDGRYLGSITIRTAVEKSRNTVAYQLFDKLNPYVCMSNLYNMEFKKLDKSDYLNTASIGGFTNGVSPLEMASGFATIENDGKFRKPTCIIKIVDYDNNEIVSDTVKEKQVYQTNACYEMTDILEGVLTRGTGRGYSLKNMSSAGKTGTTNGNKDGWFVGYTPYYTTSVWVGYDIPKQLSGLAGGSYPLYIWNKFMNEIHEGLENVPFPEYHSSETKKDTEETEEPEETLEPTEEVEPTEEPESTEEPDVTIEPTQPADVEDDQSGNNQDDDNSDQDDVVSPPTEEPVKTTKPTIAPTVKPTKAPSTQAPSDNDEDDTSGDSAKDPNVNQGTNPDTNQ